MKKIFKVLFLCCFCVFCICGCKSNDSKTAITLSDFNKISTDNDFLISDNMNEYKGEDYIDSAVKIDIDNDSSLEMIFYTDVESAIKAQDNVNNTFNYLKGTNSTSKKYNGNNYSKYVLVANNYYMVSSRVDDTLLFCKTSIGNKDHIEKLLEDMGY